MKVPVETSVDGAPIRRLAEQIKPLRDRTVAEVGRVVVGMEHVTHQFLIALLAAGHVLLEGVPGVAKTTLSKTFAHVLGIQYQRLQFTPDLLPSDVTGTYIFDRKINDFVLRKGPVFCQVLLADEVNRAPDKTQSALLEAMQENQVTIEGTTLQLPSPFMVLATQNPVEQVFTPDLILDVQRQLPQVHGNEALLHYIVDLAEASREHPDLALGASPRAALCLLRSARARALLDGRHYFTHEDVQAVAQAVLGHRMLMRPEAEVEGKQMAQVIRELLDSVPVMDSK